MNNTSKVTQALVLMKLNPSTLTFVILSCHLNE